MNKNSSYQKLKNDYIKIQRELEEVKNISDKKKPMSANIGNTIPVVNTLYRISSDLSTFKNALQFAENIQYPNRLELYRLYKDVMLDAHLSAAIQTRKSYTLSAEYIVINSKGEEVEDLSELLRAKWFYDFINLSLDSQYFGFSLIEFGDRIDNEFVNVDLVPRQYVKPEFQIVTPTTSAIEGVSYLEPPYSNWCLGIGERTNLGLLAKAAPLVLWKRGAITSFAEYTEMFGVPMRIMKTAAYDPDTRAMAENFMRNLGNSAYAIIGTDEEVEVIQAKNAAGSEAVFNGLIDKMDQQLSKLILGGVGILDEKSFVGSTKVQQDNFEMICQADKVLIENVFKYQLVPFLIKQGFPLKNCKIIAKQSDVLTLEQQFKIDSTLLEYYTIPAEYFNIKYGTNLVDKDKVSEPVLLEKPEMLKTEDPTLKVKETNKIEKITNKTHKPKNKKNTNGSK